MPGEEPVNSYQVEGAVPPTEPGRKSRVVAPEAVYQDVAPSRFRLTSASITPDLPPCTPLKYP